MSNDLQDQSASHGDPSTDEASDQNVATTGASPVKRSASKIFIWIGFIVLMLVGVGIGVFTSILHTSHKGEVGAPTTLGEALQDMYQVGVDPGAGFAGKSKIVICCMGIDDNWTNSDEVFTTGSRTDTLFLINLDITNKKVSMLSIPRDTYVPIAGTSYSTKINSAFASGGPKRTEATIQQWLGVQPDYYLVLNIDATRKLVDALGGVDVDVEHQMDYDDNWGYLHVHLKPGFQHLDGAQAVGFARFRHPNHGSTPEDGDERRMYRQHILFKAMIAEAKKPSNLIQFKNLIETGMSCVHTDLSRTQMLDLAKIFSGIDQDNDVQSASLPGEDGRNARGAYVMLVDQNVAKLYTQWMINGDAGAGRALTPVKIVNATPTPGLAAAALGALKQAGYSDARVDGTVQSNNPGKTIIIDQGVADKAAVRDIATSLGIGNPVFLRQPLEPNKHGWMPIPGVRVELGSDYAPPGLGTANQAQSSGTPPSSS